MKKNICIFLIIIVTFLVQSSMSLVLPSVLPVPNLALILTCSMGFMRGKKSGMWTGFLFGLILDLFCGRIFGLTALILLYIGYFNGFLFKVFFDEDIRVPLVAVGISDIVYGLACYLVRFVKGTSLTLGSSMIHTILPEAVCTVLFTIPLYFLYHWLNRKITANELEEEQSPWLRR
ncbi:MAG: rod shape-determining protein MreD [Bilifractor sp.]|jgi:rod shape-determining protein MreD